MTSASLTVGMLMRSAKTGVVVAAFALVLAALLVAERTGSTAGALAFLTSVLFLAVLATSAHLAFDAVLFRLCNPHDDEAAGLAAIDAVLAASGLLRGGSSPRPLAARIAGARRLVLRQRLLLAAFACSSFLLWLSLR